MNQDSEKGAIFNGEIVVNYDYIPSFSEDDWDKIAYNVKNGNLYEIGSEKEVNISGANYTVRVANNTTSTDCAKSDFSKTACGFVVEFVDIIDIRTIGSTKTNIGGWPASEIRSYLNEELFNKLPIQLQNEIIETKVISGHGSEENVNFVSTDKLYLLSTHEVWDDVNKNKNSIYDTAYNQTRQLDYYANLNVSLNKNYNYAQKQYNNTDYIWWLRTAYASTKDIFYTVNTNGIDNNYYSNGTRGISPAFLIA